VQSEKWEPVFGTNCANKETQVGATAHLDDPGGFLPHLGWKKWVQARYLGGRNG